MKTLRENAIAEASKKHHKLSPRHEAEMGGGRRTVKGGNRLTGRLLPPKKDTRQREKRKSSVEEKN